MAASACEGNPPLPTGTPLTAATAATPPPPTITKGRSSASSMASTASSSPELSSGTSTAPSSSRPSSVASSMASCSSAAPPPLSALTSQLAGTHLSASQSCQPRGSAAWPSSSNSNSSASATTGQATIAPGLLVPTLASALGINVSCSQGSASGQQPPAQYHRSRKLSNGSASSSSAGSAHGGAEGRRLSARPGSSASCSSSSNGGAASSGSSAEGWTRRPSLPIVPSMVNRVSIISVASFESLPEGESLECFGAGGGGIPAASRNGSVGSANHLQLEGAPAPLVRTNSIERREAAASAAAAAVSGSSPLLDPHARDSSPAHDSDVAGRRHAQQQAQIRPMRGHLKRASTDPMPVPSGGYDEDMMRKRRLVAMELLETERIFVASLKLIKESYYTPLMAPWSKAPGVASSSNAPVLSRLALGEIFSNFVEIFHLNSELLGSLDDRLSGRSRTAPTSRPTSIASPVTASVGSPTVTSPLAATSPTVSVSSHDESIGAPSPLAPWDPARDCVGDILLPFAPFLKMYSQFVKNFSSSISRIEAERKANDGFSRFLKVTEQDTWGKAKANNGFGFGLGFQAHMLAIVQRIPRYKLLIGELLKNTPTTHRDHTDLSRAYGVVETVASYINDHIRQHEATLVLLGLQRSMIGLPEPLVAPGRTLVKRGTMLKACRRNHQPREFFLFNDCLIYAAPASSGVDVASWTAWSGLLGGASGGALSMVAGHDEDTPTSPVLRENPVSRSSAGVAANARKRTMSGESVASSSASGTSGGGRPLSLSLDGQALQFRAKLSLTDTTVVDSAPASAGWSSPLLRHSLEIRTPDKSFAVYADSAATKTAWLEAIRDARTEYLSNRRTLQQAEEDSAAVARRERRRSLAASRRLSTVGVPPALAENEDRAAHTGEDGTSSRPSTAPGSTQARPTSFPNPLSSSSGGALAALLGSGSNSKAAPLSASGSSSSAGGMRVLEDYNAPVWVPDSQAERCICCSELFGLWRRKHHCRLCGRVVCWACSTRSFLVKRYETAADVEEAGGASSGEMASAAQLGQSRIAEKPSRACDTCYDSIFPPSDNEETSPADSPALATTELPAQQRRPSNGRIDSEGTDTSSPATPADGRPLSHCGQVDDRLQQQQGQPPQASAGLDLREGAAAAAAADEASDVLSDVVSSPSRPGGMGGGAPGGRGRKSVMAHPQLFGSSSHLSPQPQVQAATSGWGTFRLSTPRVTTPEGEREAVAAAQQSFSGGEENVQRGSGGDYFGRAPSNYSIADGAGGQPPHAARHRSRASLVSSLSSFGNGLAANGLGTSTPSPGGGVGAGIGGIRRKRLSAAARLSTYYLGGSSTASNLAGGSGGGGGANNGSHGGLAPLSPTSLNAQVPPAP